jgi:hypothetical protein
LTRTISIIVMPRKASRETSRLEAGFAGAAGGAGMGVG